LTVSEARLWGGIKGGVVGAHFRRQVPIGVWIADFASLQPRLVVEVDDPSHDLRDEAARTAAIEACGFTVLRFTNREIAEDVHGAVATVRLWVQRLQAGQRPE
jgi:very-short-patch-repair endonuclease